MERGTVNVVAICHTYLWVLILTCTVLCLFFPPCTQFCNIWTCLWSMLLMLSLQCCWWCCTVLSGTAYPHSTSDVTSSVLWCCAVLLGTAYQHSATSQHLRCHKSSAVMLRCIIKNHPTAQCHITAPQMSQVQCSWWCFRLVYLFVAQVFRIFLLWVIAVWKVVLIFCIVLVNTLLHQSKYFQLFIPVHVQCGTLWCVSALYFKNYGECFLYFGCYVSNSSDLWTVLVLPGLKGSLFRSFLITHSLCHCVHVLVNKCKIKARFLTSSKCFINAYVCVRVCVCVCVCLLASCQRTQA